MSTVEWTHGVPWYNKALRAAEHRGIVAEVSEVARVYREQSGGFAAGPEIDPYTHQPYPNRTRVTIGQFSAVIAEPEGIILGYGVATAEDAVREVVRVPRTRATYKTGSRRRRGPKDVAELTAWLKVEGYTVAPLDGGHQGVFREGNLVYTMPTTASDHRSFANTVSGIRRTTGLELRK